MYADMMRRVETLLDSPGGRKLLKEAETASADERHAERKTLARELGAIDAKAAAETARLATLRDGHQAAVQAAMATLQAAEQEYFGVAAQLRGLHFAQQRDLELRRARLRELAPSAIDSLRRALWDADWTRIVRDALEQEPPRRMSSRAVSGPSRVPERYGGGKADEWFVLEADNPPEDLALYERNAARREAIIAAKSEALAELDALELAPLPDSEIHERVIALRRRLREVTGHAFA